MKKILIIALFILNLSGYARNNSQTYTFGDLQNVISNVEISSLKYEASTGNDTQLTLKVFLCAVDNPPQIPNYKTLNIRKGKTYLVITADNNDNSEIPLPGEGDTIYFGGIGNCEVDWCYVFNGTQYMYIVLNTARIESKLNLWFLSGNTDPITNLNYEIQGFSYNFENIPSNNVESRLKKYKEYINKIASFYLTSD